MINTYKIIDLKGKEQKWLKDDGFVYLFIERGVKNNNMM